MLAHWRKPRYVSIDIVCNRLTYNLSIRSSSSKAPPPALNSDISGAWPVHMTRCNAIPLAISMCDTIPVLVRNLCRATLGKNSLCCYPKRSLAAMVWPCEERSHSEVLNRTKKLLECANCYNRWPSNKKPDNISRVCINASIDLKAKSLKLLMPIKAP